MQNFEIMYSQHTVHTLEVLRYFDQKELKKVHRTLKG